MKQFRVLFIMLTLVTFMTGFGATTSDLSKNSKTEFVSFEKATAVDFVSVVNYDFVLNDFTIFSDTTITAIDFETNCATLNTVITDVGWRYDKRYKQLANKEKVMSLKDLYHKNKNQLKQNRIREDNPFKNSTPFYIRNS